MSLDRTRAYIRQRLETYRDPGGVEFIARNLAVALGQAAPQRTGAMADAVSEVGPVSVAKGGGISIGIGNQQRLSSPEESAPAGTIADFIEDNPEFRTSRRAVDTRGRRWEPRLAWWFLSGKAKEALAAARAGGFYGGPMYRPGGPAPYYYVQDAEKPNWQASALAAGLESGDWKKFTVPTLDAWRERLHGLIGEVLGLS